MLKGNGEWAGERRFDVLVHMMHRAGRGIGLTEEQLEERGLRGARGEDDLMMEVVWKFAREPFKGDGIEVLDVKRNWNGIKRRYDNEYGPEMSFGI